MKLKRIFFIIAMVFIFNVNSVFAINLETDTVDDVVVEDTSNIVGSSSSSNSSISICENINLFENKRSSNYKLLGTYSSSLDTPNKTYGYGVVQIYQGITDKNLYAIKMNSNIKGNKESIFWKHTIKDFSWEISSENSNTTIVDWSPNGTSTATKDGIPINVGLSAGYKNIFGIDLSTSFTLFNKEDKITGYASGRNYTLELNTNEKDYSRVQYLTSALVYKSPLSNPIWNWKWSWSWISYAI